MKEALEALTRAVKIVMAYRPERKQLTAKRKKLKKTTIRRKSG